MVAVPGAKLSPRICNGVLLWYSGDTFSVMFHLDLENADGKILLTSSDSVEIIFRDCCENDVLKVTVAGVDIQDNAVRLDFDEETTAKFPAGKYTYDMDLIGTGYRISIIDQNKVIVS